MTTVSKDTSISIGRGPKLLFFSLAGAGTAAGISFTRWLLTETGEIILLLSDDGEQNQYYCDDAAQLFQEIPENIIASSSSCTSSSPPITIQIIGQSLLTISSSPHLRSIPIFLILLSSTTFLIGVFLTKQQLSRWSNSISNYYQERCNSHMISIVKMVCGEDVGDEMEVQQQQQQQQQQLSLSPLSQVVLDKMSLKKEQLSHAMLMKMDNLVMDEYVQWFIQNGVELVFGLGGGIALYSLPETMFSSCQDSNNDDDDNDGKKGAIVRQRLIRAADPWLERVLFHPGGMWDALPNGCREVFATGLKLKQTAVVAQDAQVQIKSIDDSLDTTQETLVGTEISAVSVGSTDNETDDGHNDDELVSTRTRQAHAPPISSVEMMNTVTNGDIGSPKKESVGEALYATIGEVIASNLTNAFQSKEAKPSSPRHIRKEKDGTSQRSSPQSSSPQEQIEIILHRTTIAATTIFLCQFLTSRSTRRSWMSAIKFLTSAGLFSTAISAGVASHLLRSPDDTTAPSTLPFFGDSSAMVTLLCSKICDWIQVSSSPLYSSMPPTCVDLETLTKKMRVMYHRFREEVKKDKRLQATFSLMVLYGVKQLPGRRRRVRSGGVRPRRAR